MSNCWYCYWGWSKPVAEIYRSALADLDGDQMALEYGPAHIVWGDENWDDGAIKFCLEECDRELIRGCSREQLPIVRRSLEELLALPIEQREIEPEDYDGEHPENFPPTVEVARGG